MLPPVNASVHPNQRGIATNTPLHPFLPLDTHAVSEPRPAAAAADLPVDALDYELPADLIATRPAEPRDSARMMVVHLDASGTLDVEHRYIRDLPEYLNAGDALVFNTSAVLPARFFGRRVNPGSGGGRVEGLFLGMDSTGTQRGQWRVMLRSNGRLRQGTQIELRNRTDQPGGVLLTLDEKIEDGWRVSVSGPGDLHPAAVLDRLGMTPLPPYILRARQSKAVHMDVASPPLDADDLDRAWYQTVYANPAQRGSVAAPTAGLHFTDDLLTVLAGNSVERVDIVLHVGHGTFKPVTAPTLAEHDMHVESFVVPASARAQLAEMLAHRRHGCRCSGRIIAVGTTTVRVLESLDPDDLVTTAPSDLFGETSLLIAPPYRFRHLHGLLTNFHLPRSTLLALVAAMVGLDRLHDLYREAIRHRYRFYSYGDAMLILPSAHTE